MSERSQGKSNIEHYTNVASKVDGQNGVYLSTPIVQTQALSETPGKNLIFRISSVNTCQTTTAVTGPHGTYSSYAACPNRSVNDELKDLNNHFGKNIGKNPNKNLNPRINISKDLQQLFYNNGDRNSIANFLYKKENPFDILSYELDDPNSFQINVINLAHQTDDDMVQVDTKLNYFQQKIDYLQLRRGDKLLKDINDNILSCRNTVGLGPTIFGHSNGDNSETNIVSKNFESKYKLIQDTSATNYRDLYWRPCNLFQAAVIACFLNEDDKGTDLNTQRIIWQNIINSKKCLKNQNSNLWHELNPFTTKQRAGGKRQDKIEKLRTNPHIQNLVTKSLNELDEKQKKLVRAGEIYVEYQEEEFDEKIVIEFFIDRLYKNTSKNYQNYKEYLMNLGTNIFNILENSQHGTQLPIFALKNKNITLKNPVILMNGYINIIDSKVLRYIYNNHKQQFRNYRGANSGLNLLEMADIIDKNILGDLANYKVSADLSEQKTERIEVTQLTSAEKQNLREKYFGSIIEEETENGKKYFNIISPTCYSANIMPEDLIAFDLADKYIPSDFSPEQVSGYLIKNKSFKNEEDFNKFNFKLVLANSFSKVAKENYYRFHIKWIKKDSEKLCHIPNSLFGLLDANDINNMNEEQQKILFLNYNGEDALKDKISKIKPQVLETILTEIILNSKNNENATEKFDQKFINCIQYFTKNQINALTFSNLSTNFLNNILLIQFDFIKNQKFQEIDLNSIDIIYCLQILIEKLDHVNEDQILSLNANISKELSIEILINMIDKKFTFGKSFFEGINISILKTKLFEENRFDLYINFLDKNFDNFSIDQLITINVEKDFNGNESLNPKISKRLTSIKDPLYIDVFNINNYAKSQKNLLPYVLQNENNFEELIQRAFNSWKYILEHFESFSSFINNFFSQSEDEIKKCIGFNQIFVNENSSQLIPLFNTSSLSMNVLNKIIILFFPETNENQDDENQNKSKKINFSEEQLINIPNWQELSVESLKRIFINNKSELLSDTSGKIKNSIGNFFENEIDYEKVFEILLYAPPELFKDSLRKIDMNKLKELYNKDPKKITEVMNKTVHLFTEHQIKIFGLIGKDGFTPVFILSRIEIFDESKLQNVKINDKPTRPTLMKFATAIKAQGQEEIKLKLNILKNLPAREFVKIQITPNKNIYINNFDVFFSQLIKLKKDDFENKLVEKFVNDLIRFNLFGLLIKIYEHTDKLKDHGTLDIINNFIKSNNNLSKGETDQKFISQLFKLEEVGNLSNLSPEIQNNLAIYIAGNFSNFIVLLNETDKSKPKFQVLIQFFVIIVNTLNNNSSNDEFKNEILNKIQSTNIENENETVEEDDTVEFKKRIKNKLFEIINYCFKRNLFENNSNHLILEVIQTLKLLLDYSDIQKYFISDPQSLAKAITLINITGCSLEDLKTIIENSNENVKFLKMQLLDISKRKDFNEIEFYSLKKLIMYNKNEIDDEITKNFFKNLFYDKRNIYSIEFNDKSEDNEIIESRNYFIYEPLLNFAHCKQIKKKIEKEIVRKKKPKKIKKTVYYNSYTLSINKNFDKLFSLYALGLKGFSKEIFELSIDYLKDFKNFCLNISRYLRDTKEVDKIYKPNFQNPELIFLQMFLDNINNLSDEQIDMLEKDDFKNLDVTEKNDEIINTLIEIFNKLSEANKFKFFSKFSMKILFKVSSNNDIFNYITNNEENLNYFFKEIIETDHNYEDFIQEDIFSFLSKNPQYLLKQIFEIKDNDYKFEEKTKKTICTNNTYNFKRLLIISINFINKKRAIFNKKSEFNRFFQLFYNYREGEFYKKYFCDSSDYQFLGNYKDAINNLAKSNIKYLSLENFKLIVNKIKLSNKELNNMVCKKKLNELENDQFYLFCENNSYEIKNLNYNYFKLIFNSGFKNNDEYTIKKIIIFCFGISLNEFSDDDIIEIKNFCSNSDNLDKIPSDLLGKHLSGKKNFFKNLISKNESDLNFSQLLATGLYDDNKMWKFAQTKFTTCFIKDENQKITFANSNVKNYFIKNTFTEKTKSNSLLAESNNLSIEDKISYINLLPLISINKISMEDDSDLKQNFYKSSKNSYLLQLIFKIYGQANELEVNNYLEKYKMTSFEENRTLISQLTKNLNSVKNAIKKLKPNIKSMEIEKIKQNASTILKKIKNIKSEKKKFETFKSEMQKLINPQEEDLNEIEIIDNIIDAWNSLLNLKNFFGKNENEISEKLDEIIDSRDNIQITDDIDYMIEKIKNEKIDNIEQFIKQLSNIQKLIEQIKESNSENKNKNLSSYITNFENKNKKIQFIKKNITILPSIFYKEDNIRELIENFLFNDFFGVIKYCNDNIQNQFIINTLPICVKFINKRNYSIKKQFNEIENKSFAQENLIKIFNSCYQNHPSILNKNFYNNILKILQSENFQFDKNFPIEPLNIIFENSSYGISFSKEKFIAISNNHNFLNLSFKNFQKLLKDNRQHIDKNYLNDIFNSDNNDLDYLNKKLLALQHNYINNLSENDITKIGEYYFSEEEEESNLYKFSPREIIVILNKSNCYTFFEKGFIINTLNKISEDSTEKSTKDSTEKIVFSKEIFIAILNNPNLSNLSPENLEKLLYEEYNNEDEETISANSPNNAFSFNSSNSDYLLLALKHNYIDNLSVNDITNIANYYFSENSNSNLKLPKEDVTKILNENNDWNIPFNTFFKKDNNGDINFLNNDAEEKINKIKIPDRLNYSHFWKDISDINQKAICMSKLPISELVKIDFKNIDNDDTDNFFECIYINNANLFLNKLFELKIEDFKNECTERFIKDFFKYNLFDLSKYIFENKENLSSIIKYLFLAFANNSLEFKTQENQIEKDELKKFLLGNFNHCIEQNLFDENNEANEEEANNNLLLKKYYARELINVMKAYNIALLDQELNKYKYFLRKEFLDDNYKTLKKFIDIINFKTISFRNFKKIKPKLNENENDKIKLSDEQFQDILNNENLSEENIIDFLWNYYNIEKTEYYIDTYKKAKTEFNTLEKKLALYDNESINFLTLDDIKEIKQNNFETRNYNKNDILRIIENIVKGKENKIPPQEIIKIIGVDIYCDDPNATDNFILPYLGVFFNEVDDKIEFINENAKQEIAKLKLQKYSSIKDFFDKFKGNNIIFAYLIKFPLKAIIATLFNEQTIFFYNNTKIEFVQNHLPEILSKLPDLSSDDFDDSGDSDEENNISISELFDLILPQYLFNVLDYMFKNQEQLSIFDNLFPLIISYVNKISDELSDDKYNLIKKIEIPENESTNFEFTNLLFKVFNYCMNNALMGKIEASNFSQVIFKILNNKGIELTNYLNLTNNVITTLVASNNQENYDENNNSKTNLTKTQFDSIISEHKFSNLPISFLNYVLIYSKYNKEEIKNKNLYKKFDSDCDNYNEKILLLVYLDLINFQQDDINKDYVNKIAKIAETYFSKSNEPNKNNYFSKKDIEKIEKILNKEKEKLGIENNNKAEEEKLAKEKGKIAKEYEEKSDKKQNINNDQIVKNDNDNEIENSKQKLTLQEKLENAILDLETYEYYKNNLNKLTSFLVKHLEKNGELKLESDLEEYINNLKSQKIRPLAREFIIFNTAKNRAKKLFEKQPTNNNEPKISSDLDESTQNQIIDLSEKSDENENKEQVKNNSDEISSSNTNSKQDKKIEIEDINPIQTTTLRKFLLKLKKVLPYIGLFFGSVFGAAAIAIIIITFVIPVIGQILGISLFSTFFTAAIALITPSAIKIKNNKPGKSSVENSEPEIPIENPKNRPPLKDNFGNFQNFNTDEPIPPLGDSETKSGIQNENGEP